MGRFSYQYFTTEIVFPYRDSRYETIRPLIYQVSLLLSGRTTSLSWKTSTSTWRRKPVSRSDRLPDTCLRVIRPLYGQHLLSFSWHIYSTFTIIFIKFLHDIYFHFHRILTTIFITFLQHFYYHFYNIFSAYYNHFHGIFTAQY